MNIQTIIILILIFIGLFIKPFSYGLWDFIYKFLLFVLITYLFYRNFMQSSGEGKEEVIEEKPVNRIPEEKITTIPNSLNFFDLLIRDEASVKYIKDQFLALASILIPDQGWILYKLDEFKLKVLEQITFTKPQIEDFPNQIELSGIFKIIDSRDEILIENNFQKASYSLKYYQNIEYNVSSFLSIPIKLSNTEKMFFLFDSATSEQFNKQDNEIIDKIINGIKSALNFRLKSASFLSELDINKKLLEFAISINTCNTISKAIDQLSTFVCESFEADRLTISSSLSDLSKAKIRKVVGQKDLFTEDYEFVLEEGLTGWVIGKNKPYIIEDLEKGEYFIPRYSKDEKSNYGLRSFLGVPFSANDKTFGAITLEDKKPNKYNDGDKKFLQDISNIFTTIYIRKNVNKKGD